MKNLICVLGLAVTTALEAAESPSGSGRVVEAAARVDSAWVAQPTRSVEDLPREAKVARDGALSRFGGVAARQLRATGFFRAEKVEGRWWLVDPEGHPFLSKGMSSVRTVPTRGAEEAMQKRFGSETNWAERTVQMLREHGFNTLGAWSDTGALARVSAPMPQTRTWSFMSAYGKKRGGTFVQPGHTGYPGDCIFVFDPAFEAFCEEHAKALEAGRDDPWLLGHFSDNELPFRREALRNYLALPANDPGRLAAGDWLRARHGVSAGVGVESITPRDEEDFLAFVVERYFRIVGRAIRAHDPNHLFLGSRFYGSDLRQPGIFRAAGPHVDVVSVNCYRVWTPDAELLSGWESASGRPVLITEWYAKGADSGMANTGGAGWLVRTQRERGLFYENFALALLESKACVGWHWFKYIDNDPTDTRVDPSNRDSNKGVVSNRYEPYEPLLSSMKRVNERAYSLAAYFDRPSRAGASTPWVMPEPPAGVALEKDVAYLPAGRTERADLYRPNATPDGGRRPAVIIIHGGGFNDGDKGRKREFNIGTTLAQHGYLGMSINYKLAKAKGAVTWPQNLLDAKNAVRWLRQNADRLGVDPACIGVIGCSAGGNLAAMLALTRPTDGLEPPDPPGDASSSVACAVNFYGAVDLMNYHDMKMFARTRAEAPELYRRASPVFYAHAKAAPILIVHGTSDEVVPVSQSESLVAALKAAGAPHELVLVPGAPHTFDLQPRERDLRPLVLGFLDRHLKDASRSKPAEGGR